MTWIGKILTIFVMIAALVWMFLNVQAQVTRTNWYVEAKKYREYSEKAIAAREADYRAGQADIDAVRKELERYKADVATLAGEVKMRDDALVTERQRYNDLNTAHTKLMTEHTNLDTNFAAAREQVGQLRIQNDELETKRVQLVREREQANTEKQQAINEKNAALTRVDQLTKANEELQGTIYAMKASGAREPSAIERQLAEKIAPLPDNVRGTVKRVNGDLVELTIGLDAGLTPGAVLHLKRYSPEPKYLGTLKVTNTITPKEAVAQFESASGRNVSQLRADEKPRIGDLVGVITR